MGPLCTFIVGLTCGQRCGSKGFGGATEQLNREMAAKHECGTAGKKSVFGVGWDGVGVDCASSWNTSAAKDMMELGLTAEFACIAADKQDNKV